MRTLIIRFIVLLALFVPKFVLAVMPMVSAGGNHTVALKSDGTVMAWGKNKYGQVGDSSCSYYSHLTTYDSCLPTVIYGLNGVVQVSAGINHTVALKADGTVVAWGSNKYGQLGDGTVIDRYSPVVISGLSGIVSVSAGYEHTVALKSDGTVVAWGNNDSGQLGDGTRIGRYSPVAVPGLNGVVAVSAGGIGNDSSHTVALKSDGTVVVWGNNGLGQLGLGYNSTVGFDHLPVTVPGLNGVVAVSAGADYTMALKSNGTVVGFGQNAEGELGYSFFGVMGYSPNVVPELNDVVAIDAGSTGTAAIKSDGTVIAWGTNVGDGTSTVRTNPVAVPGLNGVVAVSAGGDWSQFTVALKDDGTVVAWGSNKYGQLGDGTSWNDRYSPVVVYGGLNLGAPTNCLLNWAEQNYPTLFSPVGSPTLHWTVYTYRYYSATDAYVAVSWANNHVYYMGPDRIMYDEGPALYWLNLAGCQ